MSNTHCSIQLKIAQFIYEYLSYKYVYRNIVTVTYSTSSGAWNIFLSLYDKRDLFIQSSPDRRTIFLIISQEAFFIYTRNEKF